VERTPEQKAEHSRVTKHYFAAFKATRGVDPVFTGREAATVYQLIDKTGVERAIAAITRAYENKFTRDLATIASIAADPSKHLGKQEATTSSFQATPAAGRSWTRSSEVV
jgi:hypothetical protein